MTADVAFIINVGVPTGQIYPGQPGNLVGYANAPGYPGSLTSHSGTGFVSGTPGNPTVYAFLDINSGTGGMALGSTLHDITFIGCRFQSNDVGYYNVNIAGAWNITFDYCSFTPLASLYAAPPGATWPSAGALLNTTTFSNGVNCVAGNSGYQYGLNINTVGAGFITAQHCDIWGFGNSVVFYATTAPILIDNCWIHDAANASPQGYHTDGPGYLNGTTPPQNVTVSNCTIASIGNTNGFAFQAATAAYNNIALIGNYIAGFGYTGSFFQPGSGGATNCTVENNVFSTAVQAVFGPIYSNPTAMFTGTTNKWRGNTLLVPAGTVPAAGATFSFTSASNGKFIFPNATLSATDFTG